MTRGGRGPAAAIGVCVFVLAGCGAAKALPTPTSPASLRLHIHLDATRVAPGHALRGTLVVDNPGSPLNLTRLETSRSPDCRPAFQIDLSRGSFHNAPGFDLVCESAAFTIASGTSRFPFSVLTVSAGCRPPAGTATASVPLCLASGAAPPLPAGSYRAVIDWSEPVPLPRPPSVGVVLS